MKVFLAIALFLVVLQATKAHPTNGQLEAAAELRSDACADSAAYIDAIQKEFAKIQPSIKGNKDEVNALDYSLSCLAGCEGSEMCSMDCGLEPDKAGCGNAMYYFDALQKKFAKILPSVKGNKDQANSLDYSLGCLAGCEGDIWCSMDCGLEPDTARCGDADYYFGAIQKKFAKILPSVTKNKDEANTLDYILGCLAGCEGEEMCSMDSSIVVVVIESISSINKRGGVSCIVQKGISISISLGLSISISHSHQGRYNNKEFHDVFSTALING